MPGLNLRTTFFLFLSILMIDVAIYYQQTLNLTPNSEWLIRQQTLSREIPKIWNSLQQIPRIKALMEQMPSYESMIQKIQKIPHADALIQQVYDSWTFFQQMPLITRLKQWAGYTTLTTSARENFNSTMNGVQVSQNEAEAFERELQGELLDYWDEEFKVDEIKKIAPTNTTGFLDHMRESYEGVDDEMRKRMNSIDFAESWGEKRFQFNCDERRRCQAIYSAVAFGRSQDMQSIDVVYGHYKIEFKVSPRVIRSLKENSILWGLLSWQTEETRIEQQPLGLKTVNRLRNAVRYKAMVGFMKEGYIDRVKSADHIEDNSEE